MKTLTKNEEHTLLAILKLHDDAYLVTIRDYLKKYGGKDLSFGTLFVLLRRLEREKLVRQHTGDASPRRGGKAIRYYRLTPAGIEALRATRQVQEALWSDFNRLATKITKSG